MRGFLAGETEAERGCSAVAGGGAGEAVSFSSSCAVFLAGLPLPLFVLAGVEGVSALAGVGVLAALPRLPEAGAGVVGSDFFAVGALEALALEVGVCRDDLGVVDGVERGVEAFLVDLGVETPLFLKRKKLLENLASAFL